MRTFTLKTTKRNEFVEITDQVRRAVRDSGLTSGACVVYCPHTTSSSTPGFSA